MNDYIQNKQYIRQELEMLLSERETANEAPIDLALYCECMKQFYLSCSTNN